jgi:hypothetical protein
VRRTNLTYIAAKDIEMGARRQAELPEKSLTVQIIRRAALPGSL